MPIEIKLKILSPAFKDGEMINQNNTCLGENLNPEILIRGVDIRAKSLALIMEDPNAIGGVWTHWICFNMPPDLDVIEEGQEPLGSGALNSWNNTGYMGPCPPKGNGIHHYVFKLFSLDTTFNFEKTPTRKELEHAMIGHIIQEAKITGLFGR